jgi:hypothetical protein
VECFACLGDGSDPFQPDKQCVECGGCGQVPVGLVDIDVSSETRAPNQPNPPTRTRTVEIAEQLAAPFALHQVEYKPGVVSGNRALALAYADARVVQNRLDAVLGIDGWQSQFQVLDGGNVKCSLSIRVDGEWITKEDVGGPSDQKDGGDRMKAAFSDALKRAAVQWGVGRYLYGLTPEWRDYDPKAKRFVNAPTPCLSKAQVAEIDKLLRETKTDVQRFLGWARAESVGRVAASRYAEAIAFFRQKANGRS